MNMLKHGKAFKKSVIRAAVEYSYRNTDANGYQLYLSVLSSEIAHISLLFP
ncbi:hypothetical protein [Paraglaciecola sp.]|uniref:hypothetical protein n=1 Tax=Paraglaciecola sp. TaxID=1920173 RepID=UPI0030F3E594